ncbi:MAG: ABC transporter substrate-binding protein [bacterium]|nr:ABC transporter substrate-binding protein [bacterium]
MKRTKNLIGFSLAGVAAFALAFSAASPADAQLSSQERKLIPAAKKEGSVTLIQPLFSDRTSRRIRAAFVKRYGLGDGFKVNILRKGTGSTVATVRQEIKAGKFTNDAILVSSPGFFSAASARGAFLKLDSANWKNFTALVKKAGQYSNYPYVVTPLAYTFQPIWNASCPGMADLSVSSYADVLKPSLSGKTIASDLTKSLTYTNTSISLSENGMSLGPLWAKLKATKPLIEFRTEPKMQMVINCERPLDMWNLSGRVYQNVLKKPELAKVLRIGSYKEGQVMLGNQVAVLKGAPHPNAAKLLVEFLLTKEGADLYVEGEAIYTFLSNYTPPEKVRPYLLDLNSIKLLGMKDWIAASKRFKKVRADWVKVFR